MKMKIVFYALLSMFGASNALASFGFCEQPGMRLTVKCDAGGNRWHVCAFKQNGTSVLQVPRYYGAGMGYGDAGTMFPTGVPLVWSQPIPKFPPGHSEVRFFGARVNPNGHQLTLLDMTRDSNAKYQGMFEKLLGNCGPGYDQKIDEPIFPR